MDNRTEYEIQNDSFQRVKKEEKKISAKYSRGLIGDVIQSLKENKLAIICTMILLLF